MIERKTVSLPESPLMQPTQEHRDVTNQRNSHRGVRLTVAQVRVSSTTTPMNRTVANQNNTPLTQSLSGINHPRTTTNEQSSPPRLHRLNQQILVAIQIGSKDDLQMARLMVMEAPIDQEQKNKLLELIDASEH